MTNKEKYEHAERPDCLIDTTEAFFRRAAIELPECKQAVSMRLDADLLEWFKEQGPGYQTRINAVLRAYMKAHRVD